MTRGVIKIRFMQILATGLALGNLLPSLTWASVAKHKSLSKSSRKHRASHSHQAIKKSRERLTVSHSRLLSTQCNSPAGKQCQLKRRAVIPVIHAQPIIPGATSLSPNKIGVIPHSRTLGKPGVATKPVVIPAPAPIPADPGSSMNASPEESDKLSIIPTPPPALVDVEEIEAQNAAHEAILLSEFPKGSVPK